MIYLFKQRMRRDRMNAIKLCECGCGRPAPIATKINKKRGWIKGQPLRFIQGHSIKLKPSEIIRYRVDSITNCWVWQRSINPNGYGHLTVNNKQVLAHRFVYEFYKGPIPEGLTLDHLCRNPSCVNPDHLEPVTHAENCRRGLRAKLSPKIIEYAKRLKEMGLPNRAIAQQIGVTHTTINSVFRGLSWA